ncbi:aquaporin NIP1-2-like isoform X2 [Punica granatum]|uniref:Aquaporin NIP1-2-like isoform X2 n=1 Tax=Punica granatum TaxID=22663 RepID=A0A6P8D7A6_PUNGR|nr:aquaporin NIP1-2-like isoform X2 [Punica granatum]
MSAEHPGRCNGVALDVNEDVPAPAKSRKGETNECFTFPFVQKLIAEVAGTYFLLFSGCMSVVVNKNHDNVIGLVGISIVWGLVVTVLIYSVGHISGAHFNPAVTFAFATCGRFPWKQENQFAGTQPAGSDMQAFVIEFIITFYLMFIVSGVATDNRAIGELAGLAIGATVLLNVIFAGAITGASMNPARSLGPAVLHHHYKGLWIYILAPTLGAVAGAWVYNLIRFTDKPLREITKSGSFLKSLNRNGSSAT